MGCADMDLGCCVSGRAFTNIGFDSKDVRGGGSDGARSRGLIIGPKLEPESWGVREVRMRNGVRDTGMEASRPTETESREKVEFMEASREIGNIVTSRL